MNITDIIEYGFIQRALIAGSFIGILCSILGVFLVLRRLSLIGDGLAHATFGSVALSLYLNMSSLWVSLPAVMMCAIGILRLTERFRLNGDAAIGIVSSLGIATGILLSSVAGGFNVDLFSFLFGSILAISNTEVILSIVLSAFVLLLVSFFYNDLFSITFDEESAKVSGINIKRLNTIFVLMTAVTVVLSMKVVGIMLISALLILPPVSALQVAESFKATILIAALAAVSSVISGIVISFYLDLPTGAVIVAVNFVLFLMGITYRRMKNLWAADQKPAG
jgi:zinc transport system permease protein